MKKGFTLIELIVVIAIIGVLSGILLVTFGGSGESARAAHCMSNMRNLATACQTYAMENGHYPLAGNRIYLTMDESRGIKNAQAQYTEVPGWISTMTQGMFPGTSYRKGASVSMYSDVKEEVLYALTNGVLWKYVSGNRNTYVCPMHAKKCPKGVRPNWSYLMSAFFGWDNLSRPSGITSQGRQEYGQLKLADKRLLFSEVPFSHYNSWNPEGAGSGEETDAILQYSSSGLSSGDKGAAGGGSGNEEIGVNHLKGKNAFAHVAFADGHVEKLTVPMKGRKPDTTQMRELTGWLCAGYDVSFDGKKYQKVDN